jgi:sugar/nucleoside kinase (ribokinase family)
VRVLVAGSLTRDRIRRGETRRCQIGGVVWHAATALVELGVETRVVTRAAAEDAELIAALRRAGVEVQARHSTITTVFVNEYDAENANQRTGLRVEAAAEPIEAGHVAGALDGVDLVYLGPLHAEDISDEALAVLGDESTPPIALDVQG